MDAEEAPTIDAAAAVPEQVAVAADGGRILTVDWIGTAVFAALAPVAAALPDSAARPVAVVDLVLFAIGLVTFVWAYALAVKRSRTDAVTITGVYFLAGDAAPPSVRNRFRVAFAVQVVVALVTAAIRPYTSVAFGVLVPLFGLGLAGLWGGRHASFPPRER